MNQKIIRIANEKYKYSVPELITDPGMLACNVEAGTTAEAVINVSNSAGTYVNGHAFSKSPFLRIPRPDFSDAKNQIVIEINAQYLETGRNYSGIIMLVTDCGSRNVTVDVSTSAVSGEEKTDLKDPDRFSEFAEKDFNTAARIFSSSYFEEMVVAGNRKLINIYRGLKKSRDMKAALEEFLLTAGKKKKISVTPESQNCRLAVISEDEPAEGAVELKKDGWGYAAFSVRTEGDFLTVNKKNFTTDDFSSDGLYSLDFTCDTSKLRRGCSFGLINVRSAYTDFSIRIECRYRTDDEKIKQDIKELRALNESMKLAAAFKCGETDINYYTRRCQRIFSTLEGLGSLDIYKMQRFEINVYNHVDEYVDDFISKFEKDRETIFDEKPDIYAMYYYILMQFHKEESEKLKCAEEIKRTLTEGNGSWFSLCLAVLADSDYGTHRDDLMELLEAVSTGGPYPLIFMAVVHLLNRDPRIFDDMHDDLQPCLHWGCRHGILEREPAERYAYFIRSRRDFSIISFRDMCLLYEKYKSDDFLSAVCTMLIRGRKDSTSVHEWYLLGIKHGLRITGLYEYFMYSCSDDEETEIPESVITYFKYDNSLKMSEKAMLYVNIIKNRDKDRKLYTDNADRIREFAWEQLRAGRINRNLAFIYESVIDRSQVDRTLAEKLVPVLFTYEIAVTDPDIVGIYVRHDHLDTEDFIPVIQGRAMAHIYSENDAVLPADVHGVKYPGSSRIVMKKLLHMDDLAKICYRYVTDDTGLLLKLCSMHEKGTFRDDGEENLLRKCYEIKNVDTEFKKQLYSSMIKRYAAEGNTEELHDALRGFSWDLIHPEEAAGIMKILASEKKYEKVYEGAVRFGCGTADIQDLMKAVSARARHNASADPDLLRVCLWLFERDAADKNIIGYLVSNYTGSLDEMISVYYAASKAGEDVFGLAGKILSYSVMTAVILQDEYDIFYYYEKQPEANRTLTAAFLNINAYGYLIKKWLIPESVFKGFEKNSMANNSRTCTIACLKNMSSRNDLTAEEKDFISYRLKQLCDEGIYFEFYRKFAGFCELPEAVRNYQFIEYTADPDDICRITMDIYTDGSDSGYDTEIMEDMFCGIRVKRVVLFQNETLQYYISREDRSGNREITESRCIYYDDSLNSDNTEDEFHMINTMLFAMEMREDSTFNQILNEFTEKKALLTAFREYFEKSRKK